jgi:glucosamine-6-phosphate deaminase
MGIGENGHIAFNDPHVADFNDPLLVKVVSLDAECRQQQVHDKCFDLLNEVPTHAITLTVPALMDSKYIYCMVPGEKKAKAVFNTLNAEINEKCPATILRRHENAMLFIDKDSGAFVS